MNINDESHEIDKEDLEAAAIYYDRLINRIEKVNIITKSVVRLTLQQFCESVLSGNSITAYKVKSTNHLALAHVMREDFEKIVELFPEAELCKRSNTIYTKKAASCIRYKTFESDTNELRGYQFCIE